jgi:hypothetical protein
MRTTDPYHLREQLDARVGQADADTQAAWRRLSARLNQPVSQPGLAAESRLGGREHNDDSFLAYPADPAEAGLLPGLDALLLVADGLGGGRHGDVASAVTVGAVLLEVLRAARGTDGRIWPWGNEWDRSKCNTSDGGPGVTTPVGRYPQGVSPYGCHDMAGNVWEWCADWFAEDYYRRGPLRNPTGPESGSARVLRGGSWNNEPRFARCAIRGGDVPALRGDLRGFRCAPSPP